MTCEVAVANRLGIALAADSAATFTQAGTGARTYATGANKIFQLTEFEPVGCMIFNNSSLGGMPWELVIKAFRSHQKASFPTVQAYCDDFMDFIAGTRSSGLLPEPVRRLSSQTAIALALQSVAKRLLGTIRQLTASGLPAEQAATQTVDLANAHVGQTPICSPLTQEDLDTTRKAEQADLTGAINQLLATPEYSQLRSLITVDVISELVWRSLFHQPYETLEAAYTGVVVAGFGSDQFLPSCVSVRVFGFVAGKLLLTSGESFTMDHTGRSCYITPFATRAMVETFMLGASSNVYSFVQRHFMQAVDKACTDVIQKCGGTVQAQTIAETVGQIVPQFMNGWIQDVSNAHLIPLLKIVGGLSLEELGELADTLVMLESLKEKVTYRTQSVGGPVDVALITKSEGLVWIKRKLYFDSSLNHRYLARIERKHRGDA